MGYNTLIVLVGTSLLGVCSGLVGSFAVLRRRALTGDALAHAALPGLCLAFLILGQKNLPAMLFGAFVSGIVGIAVISLLRHATRIKEDAAIGIVLSVFFGAGIALSRVIQNRTTAGSKAGLESFIFGKTAGIIAQDVYLIGGASLFCLLVIVVFYKEFKVISFDPAYAQVQGWPSFSLDLLLMGLIAVTVVIGLPAVGVVMVAALLIIPAATARFWTESLEVMLALAALFGLIVGAVGTLVSARYSNLPAGPVIVLVGSCLFLLSMVFSPRRGIVSRMVADLRFRKRLERSNLLCSLYELSEAALPEARAVSRAEIESDRRWVPRRLDRTLSFAEQAGELAASENGYALTETGLARAAQLVRERRLWDLYLERSPEAVEFVLEFDRAGSIDNWPPELLDELDSELKATGRDPVAAAR